MEPHGRCVSSAILPWTHYFLSSLSFLLGVTSFSSDSRLVHMLIQFFSRG
jgi:hypothetical protein